MHLLGWHGSWLSWQVGWILIMGISNDAIAWKKMSLPFALFLYIAFEETTRSWNLTLYIHYCMHQVILVIFLSMGHTILICSDGGASWGRSSICTSTLLELPNMMFWRIFILMVLGKFGDWRVILLIKQRHKQCGNIHYGWRACGHWAVESKHLFLHGYMGWVVETMELSLLSFLSMDTSCCLVNLSPGIEIHSCFYVSFLATGVHKLTNNKSNLDIFFYCVCAHAL